jgi:hypothetical protein
MNINIELTIETIAYLKSKSIITSEDMETIIRLQADLADMLMNITREAA